MTKIPDDVMQAARKLAFEILIIEADDCSCERCLSCVAEDIAVAILAEREKSRKRVEELEAGLKPFADQASTFDSCGKEFLPDRFEPAIVGHTIGDLRRARALLRKEGTDA